MWLKSCDDRMAFKIASQINLTLVGFSIAYTIASFIFTLFVVKQPNLLKNSSSNVSGSNSAST